MTITLLTLLYTLNGFLVYFMIQWYTENSATRETNTIFSPIIVTFWPIVVLLIPLIYVVKLIDRKTEKKK